MSERNTDLARIQAVLDALGEHYDCVQIFATRNEGNNTVSCQLGVGNYFSRYGKVKEWVVKQEEGMRLEARSEQEPDSETDSET